MGASPSRKRVVLDGQFGSGTPATWYVGAALIIPSPDGSGWTEVTAGNYARVPVTNNVTNWPAATSLGDVTSKKNGTKITFANPNATWGNVVGWLLFLAWSGGSPEYWGLNDTTLNPKSGNTPVEYDVNQLVIPL